LLRSNLPTPDPAGRRATGAALMGVDRAPLGFVAAADPAAFPGGLVAFLRAHRDPRWRSGTIDSPADRPESAVRSIGVWCGGPPTANGW